MARSEIKRGPGRPAKAGRLEELLEAALEEFFKRGFAATRLDDVAARAGVSKGAIYVYFSSKEALFEAVVRHFLSPTVARLEALGDDPEIAAPERVARQLELLYAEIVETRLRRILRLIIAEGERFPDLVAFYFDHVIARALLAIRHSVEHGVKEGSFRADNAAREHPQLIAAPAMMAALWRLLFDDRRPLDVERYKRAHLAFALDALAPERPTAVADPTSQRPDR